MSLYRLHDRKISSSCRFVPVSAFVRDPRNHVHLTTCANTTAYVRIASRTLIERHAQHRVTPASRQPPRPPSEAVGRPRTASKPDPATSARSAGPSRSRPSCPRHHRPTQNPNKCSIRRRISENRARRAKRAAAKF
eukprot:6446877-Prymnesium_polylepis.1